MRSQILILAAALALAAGCNKSPDQGKPAAGTDKAPPQSQVNTPSTPANASGGASASREEPKEGANPVQGQVDPKDSVQQRDFRQRGDGAGPKSPETAPKSGN